MPVGGGKRKGTWGGKTTKESSPIWAVTRVVFGRVISCTEMRRGGTRSGQGEEEEGLVLKLAVC